MTQQSQSSQIRVDPAPAGDAPVVDRGQFSLERRALLLGAAATAAGALSASATAATSPPVERSSVDLAAALAKFRATIPSHFDREYVENAVVPFYLSSIFAGERPILPMIDLPLTKQDAIPSDFWGMLYDDWKPTPSEGVTVFLEGLENRGDNNLRKRTQRDPEVVAEFRVVEALGKPRYFKLAVGEVGGHLLHDAEQIEFVVRPNTAYGSARHAPPAMRIVWLVGRRHAPRIWPELACYPEDAANSVVTQRAPGVKPRLRE